MLSQYMPVLIFLGIAVAFAAVIVIASLAATGQNPNGEKPSAHECGFPASEDGGIGFDARFCPVAILFIVLDIGVVFLFPWAVALGDIGIFGFVSMLVFLIVPTVGFLYEWRKGALEGDWETSR